jgi:hypothetical protein
MGGHASTPLAAPQVRFMYPCKQGRRGTTNQVDKCGAGKEIASANSKIQYYFHDWFFLLYQNRKNQTKITLSAFFGMADLSLYEKVTFLTARSSRHHAKVFRSALCRITAVAATERVDQSNSAPLIL